MSPVENEAVVATAFEKMGLYDQLVSVTTGTSLVRRKGLSTWKVLGKRYGRERKVRDYARSCVHHQSRRLEIPLGKAVRDPPSFFRTLEVFITVIEKIDPEEADKGAAVREVRMKTKKKAKNGKWSDEKNY